MKQKILFREGAEKTGSLSEAETGQGRLPKLMSSSQEAQAGRSQVPAVGWDGGRCAGLDQGFGWGATAVGQKGSVGG